MSKEKKKANRTTRQLSVTIPENMAIATEALLMSDDFLGLPKGSLSALFTTLLGSWLEKKTGKSILDIEAYLRENPDATAEQFKAEFELKV